MDTHREWIQKPKSTNPFESDSEDDSVIFHDARETHSPLQRNESLPDPMLHHFFDHDTRDVPPIHVADEDLEAHQEAEFLSPLEAELLLWNSKDPSILSPSGSAMESEQDDFEGEDLPEWAMSTKSDSLADRRETSERNGSTQSSRPVEVIQTTGERRRSSTTKRKASSTIWSTEKVELSPVLERIDSTEGYDPFASDHRGTRTPWAKLLLLEELGTASSWAILLIPYVAFLLSLILDAYSSVLTKSVGPLNATMLCAGYEDGVNATSWLAHTHGNSCSFPYSLNLEGNVRQFQHQSIRYRTAMQRGYAFSSGPLSDVPPMSVFLRGDCNYHSLSTNAVALVAQGKVAYSSVLLQRSSNSDWNPVSISQPERLTMACSTDSTFPDNSTRWYCVRPRIVDVLFSLPGTGILSGEDLALVVLYSIEEPPYFPQRTLKAKQFAYDDDVLQLHEASYVFSDAPGAASLLFSTDLENPKGDLEELVRASMYTIEHENSLYSTIDIAVRLSTLIFTTLFLILWSRALGMKAIRSCGCRAKCFLDSKSGTLEEGISLTRRKPLEMHFWWESPWIVFPERRYLFIMLLCLILLQNPLLALAYFFPEVYDSPNMHAAADCIIGIGVFGILMILHCLFHGLRYHTAVVNRRRAKQQRQVLELQRAVKYMAKIESADHETEDVISRYLTEYYETYGDVDGSGFPALDTRLRHDPCGHDWPDFLLPKLLLLFVSISSVVLASIYRFPVTNIGELSSRELRHYNTIYISSSFVQLFMALAWMVLIVRQATRTGWMLRKEPFLSTRPVQLAYRIMFSILLLGLTALVVPFFVDLYSLLKKWTVDDGDISEKLDESDRLEESTIDVLLQVLSSLSERFPYSGTAASIGPGKIIYATVCGTIAAFIFLPSRTSSEDTTDFSGKRKQHRHENTSVFSALALNHKRDKRSIVSLARYTHSWRVFPLPIYKTSIASSLLSDVSFNIDNSERSVAFFGRYTPVFCLEIACFLLEASFQSYYSPNEFSSGEFAPGKMSLESIGLKLERCLRDPSTDTQAYVATNLHRQVDGEEDSIIVVAFRGTSNVTNMQIDLKYRQVPLLDQIIGIADFPIFQISKDDVVMNDSGSWFWDSPYTREVAVNSSAPKESCLPFVCRGDRPKSASAAISLGAKAVLAATPMTRQTLPCVHEGFLEAYSHLRQPLLECVVQVLKRQLNLALERSKRGSLVLPKIYVTGHSSGGSVGQLFALDLASNCELKVQTQRARLKSELNVDGDCQTSSIPSTPIKLSAGTDVFLSPFDENKRWFSGTGEHSGERHVSELRLQPPIAVYSFGQPRLGNHAFSRLYKQRVPHTFRVANEGDVITTMPSTVLLGGQYKHAGLEVMLDEGCTGNVIVGPTVVETMFRFSKVRTSLDAHQLLRYRENLESGLTQDELHEYYSGHGITKSTSRKSEKDNLPEWLTQVRARAMSHV